MASPANVPTLELAYDSCRSFQENEYTAIHLRIERDWAGHYCRRRACVDAAEVASIVSTDPATRSQRYLLIHGGVTDTHVIHLFESLSNHSNGSSVRHREGSCSPKKLLYNEYAYLDLWFAFGAKAFVGIHHSTFSNAVTIHRSGYNKTLNYVYSCQEEARLVYRRDRGFIKEGTDGARCRTLSRWFMVCLWRKVFHLFFIEHAG